MKKAMTAALAAMMCVGVAAQADAGVSDVVKNSGIKGGIIVHLDCNDGKETAKLRTNNNLTVQGLDTSQKDIDAARTYLTSQGLYGKVTANLFDGKGLPYADDLVNIVVSESATQVPESEILRVLCPLGTAYINGKQIIKPWPEDIDDWGHFLHGPDNNAVAQDKRVGMPRVLQWVDGRTWARSHEAFSTISVAVSAHGGYLRIVSKEDGSMTKELELDGVPVSDGMSVANGELCISLKNGVVCCYGK